MLRLSNSPTIIPRQQPSGPPFASPCASGGNVEMPGDGCACSPGCSVDCLASGVGSSSAIKSLCLGSSSEKESDDVDTNGIPYISNYRQDVNSGLIIAIY